MYNSLIKCNVREKVFKLAEELAEDKFSRYPQIYIGGPNGNDISLALAKFKIKSHNIFAAERDKESFKKLSRKWKSVNLYSGDVLDTADTFNVTGKVIFSYLDFCGTNNENNVECLRAACKEWAITKAPVAYTFSYAREGDIPFQSLIDKYQKGIVGERRARAYALFEYLKDAFKPKAIIEYQAQTAYMTTVIGTAEKNTGSFFPEIELEY